MELNLEQFNESFHITVEDSTQNITISVTTGTGGGSSGDYEDLLNKPDLSVYATKTEVNAKASTAYVDSGNVTQNSRLSTIEGVLPSKASNTYVDNQLALKANNADVIKTINNEGPDAQGNYNIVVEDGGASEVYVDNSVAAAIVTANTYADTKAAEAETNANDYTDISIANINIPDVSNFVQKTGDIISGDLVPNVDNTHALGSPTKAWKDVYIGPGSLYVNGTKVIEEVADTITVRADVNQNLAIKTSGIGNLELVSINGFLQLKGSVMFQAGKLIRTTDGSPFLFDDSITMSAGETIAVDNLTKRDGTPFLTSMPTHNHNDLYYLKSEVDAAISAGGSGGVEQTYVDSGDLSTLNEAKLYVDQEIGAIPPVDLSGKADVVHTHTLSQISDFPGIPNDTSELTNGAGYITGLSWAQLTGKPTTFTPSTHTHDDRYYTETEMNSFLSGKVDNSRVLTDVPLNAKFTDTTYQANSPTHFNQGPQGSSTDRLISIRTLNEWADFKGYAPGGASQTYVDSRDSVILGNANNYTDTKFGQVPPPPTQLSQLVNDSNYITGLSWSQLTEKPTQFEPTAHTHSVSDIVDFPAIPTFTSQLTNDSGYITGMPVHDHNDLYYSKAQVDTSLNGKVNTSQVLTNVPAGAVFTDTVYDDTGVVEAINTKADVVHTHTVSEISDFPVIPTVPTNVSEFTNDSGFITLAEVPETDLSGKADVVHSHPWGEITDKPSLFVPIPHPHPWSDITGKPAIPNDTSDLTNGAGFITLVEVPETDLTGYATETYVDDAIAAIEPTDTSNKLDKQANIQGFWRGTQEQYDLLTPDANTLYFIEEV